MEMVLNLKEKENSKSSEKIDFSLPKFSIAEKQTTINKKLSFSGIGLHSGKKVTMNLFPAEENTGFLFKVKNGPNSLKAIRADYKNVSSTRLCTTITNDKFSVSTTEHILSALYALKIDNVIIELTENEVPVMDGSSKDFFETINESGISSQFDFKKLINIKKTIEVSDGNKIVRVSPHNETLVTCEINYKTNVIGNQSISLVLNPDIYKTQISNARTFGFLEDVSKLRDMGLALGGSLENAIVISDDKILNKEGLRYNDEFVRHKALDLIGDIALSGHQIIGSFFSYHAGHALNNKLLHKIFSSNENWEFIDSN